MYEKLHKAACIAIDKVIVENMTSYGSPLNKYTVQIIEDHAGEFKKLLNDSMCELLNGEEFQKAIKKSIYEKIGKILINKAGGEIEKKINELKQDTTSRAKITLALSKLIDNVIGAYNE